MGIFLAIKMKDPKISITSQLLKLIAEIDEFKGQWSMLKLLSPERLQALRTLATIESVGSSTRIEGAKLSDQEVEKLLSGLEAYSFRSRDEEEVAGYAEGMNTVFESYGDIPFTENYIKQLHGILLRYSTKDIHHRGEYKKLSNHVEAFDSAGKSIGVVFETATPFETPLRMAELIEWTHRSLEEKTHHPLLVIAVFILHFLAIHPFQDGNGRLSRILTTLLLLQKGYLYVPYSSLEHVIELNKEKYYLALRRSQKYLASNQEDLDPWFQFFFQSLQAQKDALAQKMEKEKVLVKLSALSQKILELVKQHGSLNNGMIQAATGANRNTIKAHLKKLVEAKWLVQHGTGKGTRYSF